MSEGWARFEDGAEARGYALIPNAVMRSPAISLQAKSLYGLLKSYAWQDASTYPGVKTLCGAAGVSKDTLGKYLKELVEARLLEVRRRGQGMTNLYVFKSVLDSRILDGDTGSHQESDTGSRPDGDPSSRDEDAGNEDAADKAPSGEGRPSASGVGELCQYLREVLDGADVPLLKGREERYGKEFKRHLDKGVGQGVLYKAADRINERWRGDDHRKLTVEQALEDVTNGRAPAHARGTPGARSATPEHVVDYVFANTRNGSIRTREPELRRAMARHDFTSSESPPYPVEKILGGSANERWSVLESLRSLCRRAVREAA